MNTKHLQLLVSFLSNNTGEGLRDVLEDLLTPEEIKNIYERIMILQDLKTGLTQREIAKKLGVSSGTVSRGSRILKYGKRGGKFKF